MSEETNLLVAATRQYFRKIREMQIAVTDENILLRLVTTEVFSPNWLQGLKAVLYFGTEPYVICTVEWIETDGTLPTAILKTVDGSRPPVTTESPHSPLNNVDMVSIVYGAAMHSREQRHKMKNANSISNFRARATVPDIER